MSSAGLDFGNKHCVIGILNDGSISILLDDTSSRLVPTSVSYSTKRRYYGDSSIQQQSSNLLGTINQLKRLVCLPFESEEREYISNLVSFPLIQLKDGFTGVLIQNSHDKYELRIEQCIAYLFKELLKLVQKNKPNINGFTITVSPWWSERHRRAIIDSCKIANIECFSLLNSTTAAAITYCMNHRNHLPKQNENKVPIVFIDLGDSSLNVAIALIKANSVEIKSFSHDQHLGGSHFTNSLVKYLLEKIQIKYKINPLNNPKTMIRFVNAAEKLKKNLFINQIVSFELSSIEGDKDISLIIKREEFESQIIELVDRIVLPINQALEYANISKDQIYAIELLGGGSRIPLIRSKITEIFGKEPSQSLNLDECFATGSGYMSFLLNPLFKVPLEVIDITPYSIIANWIDLEGEKNLEIFPKFSKIPSSNSFLIKINFNININLFSNNLLISTIKIEYLKNDNIEVIISLYLDQSSLIHIKSITFKENEIEKHLFYKFEYNSFLSNQDILNYQDLETFFSLKDEEDIKIDEKKNELESILLKVDKAINKEFIDCFDPNHLNIYKDCIGSISNWFYNDDIEKNNLNELQNKINDLNIIYLPAFQRFKFYYNYQENDDYIKNKKDYLINYINVMKDKLSKEIFENSLSNIGSFYEKYLIELSQSLKQDHYLNPIVKFDDLYIEIQNLENKLKNLIDDQIKNSSKSKWCKII